jgi:hypothetical protein
MKFVPFTKDSRMLSRRQLTSLAILATGLLSLGSSCKDKNNKSYCEENPTKCSDIQGAKDYFLFKEGSWWVYQEENSLDKDSVYVTEYSNDPNSYDFDMRVYSVYQDYSYHLYPFYAGGSQLCNASGNIHSTCLSIKRSKYKPGDALGEATCFMWKNYQGQVAYVPNSAFENNQITVAAIMSTFAVQGVVFNDVVKIHELNTFIEGRQPTNHYFAKGVGLIRKELLDSNQVWNLVSYHIEP